MLLLVFISHRMQAVCAPLSPPIFRSLYSSLTLLYGPPDSSDSTSLLLMPHAQAGSAFLNHC